MARIIEFHTHEGFKPTMKWVPQEDRGALVVFSPNLTKSAPNVSALGREMTQQMSTQLMELALVIWPL